MNRRVNNIDKRLREILTQAAHILYNNNTTYKRLTEKLGKFNPILCKRLLEVKCHVFEKNRGDDRSFSIDRIQGTKPYLAYLRI